MKETILILIGLLVLGYLIISNHRTIVEGFESDGPAIMFWGGSPGDPDQDTSIKEAKQCESPKDPEAAVKAGKLSKSWVKDGKIQFKKDPSCTGDDCERIPGWQENKLCRIEAFNDPEGGKAAALDICNKTKGCIGVNWMNYTEYAKHLDPTSKPLKNQVYLFEMASDKPKGCGVPQRENLSEWQKYCNNFSKTKIGPAFAKARKLSELDQYLGPMPLTSYTDGSTLSMCETGSCGDSDCPITISSTPQTGSKTTSCWFQGGDLLNMAIMSNTKKGKAVEIYQGAGKYMGSFPKSGGSPIGGIESSMQSAEQNLMKDVKSIGKKLGDMF